MERVFLLCLTLLTPTVAMVVAAPTISLLQLLPRVPPLEPGAAAAVCLELPGGLAASPVFLPSISALVCVDRGQPLVCDLVAGSSAPLPGAAVCSSFAAWQENHVAACGPAGVVTQAVGAPKAFAAEPITLVGALGSPVRCAAALRGGHLLAVSGDALVTFSPDAPPATLLSAAALAGAGLRGSDVVGLAVDAEERSLYLCSADAVHSCSLDADGRGCGAPARVPLAFQGGAGVALDVAGCLYLATADGLLVADESGERPAAARAQVYTLPL